MAQRMYCGHQHGQFRGNLWRPRRYRSNPHPGRKGHLLGEWLLRQLKRTNNREDYSTDEVLPTSQRSRADGYRTYYRSSSPVNDELGRAFYATLAKAAGIKTVINLADSQAELEQYFFAEGFNSPYYKTL